MNDNTVCCQIASVTEPQRDGGTACRDGEGFSSPLTRFAGAPPEGEPFINRSTIPLPVILSGGGAVCRPR